MYGVGLVRGLGITLKHFFDTYTADLKWLGKKYTNQTFHLRQSNESEGIFTVEYPDEKLAMFERFRFIPFLVMNNLDDPYAPGEDWCTSCGICAKVCPPQCIWIVRGSDPETGRPVPQPEAFYIDVDICMNCGYCAEYCPFDAIKMDHDYELASFDRTTNHIFDKNRLSKEFRYWESIAPNRVMNEAQARGHWEHRDVEKAAKKAGITLPPPTEENKYRATTVLPESAPAAAPTAPAAAGGAARPAVAAPAAAAPVTGDPIALMADEKLPLNVRAAAAVKVKQEDVAKTRKLSGADRKLISAVQKAAKEQGTTIEELAASAGDISKVAATSAPVASAPAPAAAPAVPRAAAPAPSMVTTNAQQLLTENPMAVLMDAAQPLNVRAAAALAIKNDKNIKLTSENRKAISEVQKVAKAQGTTIEELATSVGAATSLEAGTPAYVPDAGPEMGRTETTPLGAAPEAVSATPETAPADAATYPTAAQVDNPLMAEIQAAKDLEAGGKAKTIKLTGEDRKRIAKAKASAKDAGIPWE